MKLNNYLVLTLIEDAIDNFNLNPQNINEALQFITILDYYIKTKKIKLNNDLLLLLFLKNKTFNNTVYLLQDNKEKIITNNRLIQIIFDFYHHNFLSISNNLNENDKEFYLNYIKSLRYINIINLTEEKDLLIESKNGNIAALNMLVENYLPLVVSIIKDFKRDDISTLDLISEGNQYLRKAIMLYDLNNKVPFEKYLKYYIIQKIKRYLEHLDKNNLKDNYFFEDITKYKDSEYTNRNLQLQSTIEQEILIEDQNNRIYKMLKDILTEEQYKLFDLLYGISGNKPLTGKEVTKLYNVTRQDIDCRLGYINTKMGKLTNPYLLLAHYNPPKNNLSIKDRMFSINSLKSLYELVEIINDKYSKKEINNVIVRMPKKYYFKDAIEIIQTSEYVTPNTLSKLIRFAKQLIISLEIVNNVQDNTLKKK